MNLDFYIDQLRCNRDILLSTFKSLDPDAVHWHLDSHSWSPLITLCHLIDEEKYDFRYRAMYIIEQADIVLPSINPSDWITEHSYIEQDYHSKMNEFNQERNISIALLTQLSPNDIRLSNTYNHPQYGKITTEFFLKNWLAHDLLHLKQINKLKYDYLKAADNISIEYAGKWT